jgi:L-galactose dehydrogenase
VRYRQFGRTGLRLSEIGFGASPLGNEFGSIDEEEGVRAVRLALDLGINFFDVAAYYGRGLAETRLGAALRGRRDEAIVATKCARYDVDRFDFSAASVKESIDASLRRLGTGYVDIFHVHDIEFGDGRQIIEETIPAMREVQKSGKARFIGITGLSVRMLEEVAREAPVDCILSYCRYNLLNRDLELSLAPFAERQGIGMINASPLHMGLLSERGGPPWHPAPEPVKATARKVVDLCRTRKVCPADIALQFALGRQNIASTLVGMSTSDEVRSNVSAAGETPDRDLLADLDVLTRPVQDMIWITGRPENH